LNYIIVVTKWAIYIFYQQIYIVKTTKNDTIIIYDLLVLYIITILYTLFIEYNVISFTIEKKVLIFVTIIA